MKIIIKDTRGLTKYLNDVMDKAINKNWPLKRLIKYVKRYQVEDKFKVKVLGCQLIKDTVVIITGFALQKNPAPNIKNILNSFCNKN